MSKYTVKYTMKGELIIEAASPEEAARSIFETSIVGDAEIMDGLDAYREDSLQVFDMMELKEEE